jgi:FAD/FMN-containing dehydrogenase
LRIIGQTRTPFAVKGGGHATNPGFSSTSGVQIAMARFNQVIIDETASTVEIGAGLVWDDVYRALDGTGLNVAGGRVGGVGVAGFILGGGEWSS